MSEKIRTVYSDTKAFEPDPIWPDENAIIAKGGIAGKYSYRKVVLPNEYGPDLFIMKGFEPRVVEVWDEATGEITYEPYDLSKHGEFGDLPPASKRTFEPEFGAEDLYDKSWG